MAKERKGRLRIRADREAQEFLRRLADDQEFRSRLEKDPAGALAEYGVEAEDVPEEVKLPEPDAVRDVLAAAQAVEESEEVELPPEGADILMSFLRPLGAMPLVPAAGDDHAG